MITIIHSNHTKQIVHDSSSSSSERQIHCNFGRSILPARDQSKGGNNCKLIMGKNGPRFIAWLSLITLNTYRRSNLKAHSMILREAAL